MFCLNLCWEGHKYITILCSKPKILHFEPEAQTTLLKFILNHKEDLDTTDLGGLVSFYSTFLKTQTIGISEKFEELSRCVTTLDEYVTAINFKGIKWNINVNVHVSNISMKYY